jgi:hypothetical protein
MEDAVRLFRKAALFPRIEAFEHLHHNRTTVSSGNGGFRRWSCASRAQSELEVANSHNILAESKVNLLRTRDIHCSETQACESDWNVALIAK